MTQQNRRFASITAAAALAFGIAPARAEDQAPPAAAQQPPAAALEERTQAEQTRASHLDLIAPFVGPDTVAVAHLNLSELNADATRDWLSEVFQAVETDPRRRDDSLRGLRARLDLARDWVADMKAAGATDLFVTLALPEQSGQPSGAVIVPLAGDAKPDAIRELLMPEADNTPPDLPPGFKLEAATLHGAMVLAPAGQLEGFRQAQGGDITDVEQALSVVKDSTAHAALLPRPQFLNLVQEMFGGNLPKGIREGNLKTLPEKAKWFAYGIESPPKEREKLVIKAADARTAEQMAEEINAALEDLKNNKELSAQVNNLDELARMLTPTVEGDQVIMSLNRRQINALLREGVAGAARQAGAPDADAAQPAAGQQDADEPRPPNRQEQQ